MNNYKEFTNYSIKTSYVNIIKYSNEISSDIEDCYISEPYIVDLNAYKFFKKELKEKK